MGFFDEIKKTAASIKEQVDKSGVLGQIRDVAGGVTGGAGPTDAAAPTTPPAGTGDVWGCGSADPLRWISVADVSAITGVAVGPGAPTDTAETFGVAFDGSDARGTFRFEIHTVDEDVIGRYNGCQRWIDEHAGTHDRHRVVSTFGDYTATAADGDSHFWFFAWVADSCMYAEAHTPGVDVTDRLESLLRRIYDWDE